MIRFSLIISMLCLLTACGSQEERSLNLLTAAEARANASIQSLRSRIQSGLIRNAKYIESYANIVADQKPELSEIVDLVRIDSTINSPIFEGLESRLATSQEQIVSAANAGTGATNELLTEINNINYAASAGVYDAMLADSVNVLADMSDGVLSRVASLTKSESLSANGAEDMGAGSQYVGNPSYGQWQTDNSGNSFWSWYGKYALFSSLFNRGPIGYGYWASNRDYSYYHDTGRNYYSSPTQRTSALQAETRTRNNFASQGRSFNSPYASTKSSGTRPSTTPYNSRTSSAAPSRSRSTSSGGK